MRAYLAGSIFTESALMYNQYLLNGIRHAWPGISVYASQENNSINDKTKSATEKDIYAADNNRLEWADMIIAVISGDPCPPIGTSTEVGIFAEMCKHNPNKILVGLCHDTRDPAFTYSETKNNAMKGVSCGSQYNYVNLLLTGAIKSNGVMLSSSDQLFEYIHELWMQESKKVLCGIYKITNRENGKIYVGQSLDIYNRWKTHISRRNHPHHNSAIEAAIGKYGYESFDFEIIELCDGKQLNEKEQYWIKENDCIAPKGYNLTEGGDQCANVELYKPCSCYDINTGLLVATYSSIHDAARHGFNRQRISQCCNSKDGTCSTGGYFWQFGTDKQLPESFSKPQGGSMNKKTIYQYDMKTGQYVGEFISIAEAAQTLGDINYNKNIGAAVHGKRNYAYGYKWSFFKFDIAPDNLTAINANGIISQENIEEEE